MFAYVSRNDSASLRLVCGRLLRSRILGRGLSHGNWIISFGATFVAFAGFLAVMWNRSFDVKKFENMLSVEEKMAVAK